MAVADRDGFTLIELSIVIVLIGLLIGGILVGQSLIQSAKINAFIRQIQQIDIAVSTFKAKYKALPGDSTRMPNPGNGNGLISAGSFTGEVTNFWPHLSISGFDPLHRYSATIPAAGFNSDPNILNAPFAVVGTKSSIIPWRDISWMHGAHTYKISNTQAISTIAPSFWAGDINSVEYTEAISIDKKFDDGNTNAGIVVMRNYLPDTWTGTLCSAALVKCTVYIEMLSQISEEQ